MTKPLQYITFITLGFLLWLFLSSKFNSCGNGQRVTDTISIKADTVWQDTGTTVIIKESVPYAVKGKDSLVFVYLDKPQPKPEPTDTAGIIKEYLSTYVYDSTYLVQYGTLRLMDTLSENRFIGRRFDLQQKIPEIKTTITIERTKRITFGGQLGIGAMYNGKLHFGPYVGAGVTVNLSK